MTEPFLLSIMATGFIVAFAHAAIPTHWLPFVLAGRGQRWSKGKTLAVVALCGFGHVLFTTLLGVLVVWLGIETSKLTGNVFPWIAGGALILFGLYYFWRQMNGDGHGHSHFGPGHSHDGAEHDHSGVIKRIHTGHGVLLLEVFEDAVPPRFRVRAESSSDLPKAGVFSVEIARPDGAKQAFSFAARDGFLESLEEIPEPHEFKAIVSISHGSHSHSHEVQFEEHTHSAAPKTVATTSRAAKSKKSDRAVIIGLFTILTFSPCEGFLPVYLSGISYGWFGFLILSAVLAFATISGMVSFTWLTLSGIEKLPLGFLERYESGILGATIFFLGSGIIFLGF